MSTEEIESFSALMDRHEGTLKSLSEGSRDGAAYLLSPERAQRFELLTLLICNLGKPLAVCGPDGIGKTTFLGLLEERAFETWQVVSLRGNSVLQHNDILAQIAEQIGVGVASENAIGDYLEQIARNKSLLVLLVDDAGKLAPGVLTSLWQFTRQHAALRLVLALRPDEAQLKTASDGFALGECHFVDIPVLTAPQCKAYLRRLATRPPRLLNTDDITPARVRALYRATHGVPGRIVQTLTDQPFTGGGGPNNKIVLLAITVATAVISAAAMFFWYKPASPPAGSSAPIPISAPSAPTVAPPTENNAKPAEPAPPPAAVVPPPAPGPAVVTPSNSAAAPVTAMPTTAAPVAATPTPLPPPIDTPAAPSAKPDVLPAPVAPPPVVPAAPKEEPAPKADEVPAKPEPTKRDRKKNQEAKATPKNPRSPARKTEVAGTPTGKAPPAKGKAAKTQSAAASGAPHKAKAASRPVELGEPLPRPVTAKPPKNKTAVKSAPIAKAAPPKPAAPSSSSTPATVGQNIAGVRPANWLLSQPGQSYTLRIMLVREWSSIKTLMQRYPSMQGQVATFKSANNAGEWHSVYYGVFASEAEARQAATKLPSALGKTLPRQIKQVQQEANAVRH